MLDHTSALFVDEAIITNDLVELQDDQSFVLKGRIDNVINSGGFKLMPEEIEQKLSQFLPFRFLCRYSR